MERTQGTGPVHSGRKSLPVGKMAALAISQALLRAAAFAWPFLMPLLLGPDSALPGWLWVVPSALIYVFGVIPCRCMAGEKLRAWTGGDAASLSGGKPYLRWLLAGLARYGRGIVWGLPFLVSVGYLADGYQNKPFNEMWEPIMKMATLMGKEPTLAIGLPMAGALLALFGLVFAYGWWRDIALEYLPVRHMGVKKAFRSARSLRKKGKGKLLSNIPVHVLLTLPSLAGFLLVLLPYVLSKVRAVSSIDLMVTQLLRVLRSPLPKEQLLLLLAVFLAVHLPLCMVRKARNAALMGKLMQDSRGLHRHGHAAG